MWRLIDSNEASWLSLEASEWMLLLGCIFLFHIPSRGVTKRRRKIQCSGNSSFPVPFPFFSVPFGSAKRNTQFEENRSCRPFFVRRLDWPIIEAVGLFFAKSKRLCSNSVIARLSIQSPACLSWTSCFLLWWSRSRSWSLELVCFFAFAFSDLYFKLLGDAVLRGPNSYRVLVWIHPFLSLFNVQRCVDSNSVEVWLEYLDCNSLASWAWKWGFHSYFDNTAPFPLSCGGLRLRITWRSLC